MEKEPLVNIVTKGAADSTGRAPRGATSCIVKNANQAIKALSKTEKTKQIVIYDITYMPKSPTEEILNIKDHINQTGENWLRGNQNKLNISFIDVGNLYSSKKGVITTCLGKHYNDYKKLYKHPSTEICNIAIIARAMGFNKIAGRLINSNA